MNPTIHINAPASKSLSHRAIICAALARGESMLHGVLDSEDVARTKHCLHLLGAQITGSDDTLCVCGVKRENRARQDAPQSMDVGESGTTCRLMAAVAAAFPGKYRFHGQGRMHDRPIEALTESLQSQGATIIFEGKPGCPPFLLTTPGLSGGDVRIDATHSSQYLSGLLLAAPLAARQTTIFLTGKGIASWPYVALTLECMTRFGVAVALEHHGTDGWQPCAHDEATHFSPETLRFVVQPGPYVAQNLRVEGDWSNASYFLAAGAVGKTPVRISGLHPHSAQGDRFMLEILHRMGANICWDAESVTVFPSRLHGAEIDMGDCPDIVPTVAVMAAFATGETILSGAAQLALKECDRILAPVTELTTAGVRIEARPDGMIIHGQGVLTPGEVHLNTHNDHRMAMSLSLLELGGQNVHLDNPDCVKKSFPRFWEAWAQVRRGNQLERQT